MLKYLLINIFVFEPFWKSQILTQMTTISDFGGTLIILRWKASTMLLNIYVNLIMLSTILGEIRRLVSLIK